MARGKTTASQKAQEAQTRSIIGQAVKVNNFVFTHFDQMTTNCRTNKSGPAGNQNFHRRILSSAVEDNVAITSFAILLKFIVQTGMAPDHPWKTG